MEEALAKNPHTLRPLQNIETESEQDAGFMPWWGPSAKCEWWMVEGIFSTNQYRCKW